MTIFSDFCDHNEGTISELARKFSSYVFNVEETHIRNWLKQFGENNTENLRLGLQLLNKTDYFSPRRIINEARDLHNKLLACKDMSIEELLRKPTYFVDFSPSSGHSQDALVAEYRLACDLRHMRYDKHFIYLRDINNFIDKKGITLVFLTDFIGSGKQVCDIWKEILWSISPNNEHFLLSICAYDSGILRIRQETENKLCTITNRRYTNINRVFADENPDFTPEQKGILRALCETAGEYPTGFEDVQSTVVFYFRCPNDAISILRANNANWVGLFKRYAD